MESVHRQSPCRAGEIKKNATGEKGGVGADPLQPSHQELRGNGDERKYGIEGELRAQGPRLHHAPEEKVGVIDLNEAVVHDELVERRDGRAEKEDHAREYEPIRGVDA